MPNPEANTQDQVIVCANTNCSNHSHLSSAQVTSNILELSNIFWFCDNCVTNLRSSNIVCDNPTLETPSSKNTLSPDLILNQDSLLDTVVSKLSSVVLDTTAPILKSFVELDQIVLDFGTQISHLSIDCQDLQQQLDSIEAHSKRRNIEITGVPYRSNEKIENLFISVCNLVGLNPNLELVERIYRIKPRDNSNFRKSIVVEFRDQSTRDTFLSKAKLCNQLTLFNLGFQDSSLRFFVNEHLTRLKKYILHQLKHFKEDIEYDRLWVRNGQIYVRFTDQVVNVSSKEVLRSLLRRRDPSRH